MAITEHICRDNVEEIAQQLTGGYCDFRKQNEIFCEVCKQGRLDIVEWMTLYTDIAVNYVGQFTPLSAACSQKQLNVAKYLVHNLGADVNLQDGRRVTPLIDACNNGNLDVIKWLITINEVDVNATDYRGLTPLMTVCYMGQLDAVKILVQSQRVDVNQPDWERRIPLTAAWRNMHIPIVNYFLQEVESLNVNFVGYNGNTALHYAVWYSHRDRTELHDAIINGDMIKASQLIYCKSHTIDQQDNDGHTALHLASMNGKGDAMLLLLSCGAYYLITDDWNLTAGDLNRRRGYDVMFSERSKNSFEQIFFKDFPYEKIKPNRKRLMSWPPIWKPRSVDEWITSDLKLLVVELERKHDNRNLIAGDINEQYNLTKPNRKRLTSWPLLWTPNNVNKRILDDWKLTAADNPIIKLQRVDFLNKILLEADRSNKPSVGLMIWLPLKEIFNFNEWLTSIKKLTTFANLRRTKSQVSLAVSTCHQNYFLDNVFLEDFPYYQICSQKKRHKSWPDAIQRKIFLEKISYCQIHSLRRRRSWPQMRIS